MRPIDNFAPRRRNKLVTFGSVIIHHGVVDRIVDCQDDVIIQVQGAFIMQITQERHQVQECDILSDENVDASFVFGGLHKALVKRLFVILAVKIGQY